jgi:site-specific recombinase XerD
MRSYLNTSSYTFLLGEHHQSKVIWIAFPKDAKLIAELRQAYPAVKWSASAKKWYLPDVQSIRAELKLDLPNPYGKAVIAQISPINLPAFNRFVDELKLKAYSPNTQRTYTTEFAQLLYILKNNAVEKLTPEKLRSYLLYCIQQDKISEQQLNSRINAIKFYFEKVLKQEKFFFDIPRPKKPSTLPKVIGTKDIVKLFDQVENPKHLLMLKLCYGMGLRVSEIVQLKVTDIDSTRMQVLLQAAKGKKDRYVPLPQDALEDLRAYYKAYRPKHFLFEGQYGGQYSARSAQAVFKKAMIKAKINKPVGIHSLRHSYATHLLEYGTDITHIQKLLGHKDLKTTQLYAKVSQATVAKVKSPLDRLKE